MFSHLRQRGGGFVLPTIAPHALVQGSSRGRVPRDVDEFWPRLTRRYTDRVRARFAQRSPRAEGAGALRRPSCPPPPVWSNAPGADGSQRPSGRPRARSRGAAKVRRHDRRRADARAADSRTGRVSPRRTRPSPRPWAAVTVQRPLLIEAPHARTASSPPLTEERAEAAHHTADQRRTSERALLALRPIECPPTPWGFLPSSLAQ